MKRDVKKSEQIIEGLMTEYPDNAMIHYFRGKQFYFEKKPFKARAELEKALRLQGRKPERWVEDAKKMLDKINQEI